MQISSTRSIPLRLLAYVSRNFWLVPLAIIPIFVGCTYYMSKRFESHNSISVLTIGFHLTHSLIFATMSLGSKNYFVALACHTYMEFADTIDNLSVEIARLRKQKRRSGTHRNHILLHFRSHVLNPMVYAFSGRACCSLSAYCGRLTFFVTSGISDVCNAHEIARLCFEKLSADTYIPLGASGASSETSENLSAGTSLLPEFASHACSCRCSIGLGSAFRDNYFCYRCLLIEDVCCCWI